MKNSSHTFYITTPIFYPNGVPHLGHAYSVTLSDIFNRYHKLVGDSTYFLTGLDENTGKILKEAAAKGQTTQEYLGDIRTNFTSLYKSLGAQYDQFIVTTDKEAHWPGALAMWKALSDAGDIYQSRYTGLYCLGCETFYTEKDLVDGKCPVHLTVPEKIEEENYFFRLSKYTEKIREKITSGEFNIIPVSRKNEILAFLDRGLEDVSFSRPISVVPHGIPVPGDPKQVMYVWCDALTNYISALGFGTDRREKMDTFWPASVHVMGKDILRFHAAIWPAMLMSAGLPLPKNLLVHGLITSGGHKMSKSLGNVIDPHDLISEYGAEALRYYIGREISPFDDGDVTLDQFKNVYNAQLANGLGNLVSRVMRMALNYAVPKPALVSMSDSDLLNVPQYVEHVRAGYHEPFARFECTKAADFIWDRIDAADKKIQQTEPFKLYKTDAGAAMAIVAELVEELAFIAVLLKPFLPETAEKIQKALNDWEMPAPLFARK
jgi:methionyl-tRNA synthetase